MEGSRAEPLKCPICQGEMKKEVKLGTQVDLCTDHGIWLDKGELQKITSSIRGIHAKGMVEQRKQGRFEGIFWGWMSFLIPRR